MTHASSIPLEIPGCIYAWNDVDDALAQIRNYLNDIEHGGGLVPFGAMIIWPKKEPVPDGYGVMDGVANAIAKGGDGQNILGRHPFFQRPAGVFIEKKSTAAGGHVGDTESAATGLSVDSCTPTTSGESTHTHSATHDHLITDPRHAHTIATTCFCVAPCTGGGETVIHAFSSSDPTSSSECTDVTVDSCSLTTGAGTSHTHTVSHDHAVTDAGHVHETTQRGHTHVPGDIDAIQVLPIQRLNPTGVTG